MRQERFVLMAFGIALCIGIIWMIGSAFDQKPDVFNGGNDTGYVTDSTSYSGGTGNTGTTTTVSSPESHAVPWDYQVKEAQVGDLLGEDMLLLPDNVRISNDQNLATGDKVWVLSYMSADMKTDSQGRSDVTLSQWEPIKTFKTQEEAEKDLAELKKEIKTEVDLVGVYKTELDGKYRYFAVADMPTGQKVKQPISEERYASFTSKKQVQIVLEEVHDYSDYDLSMAKFRGWAE